MTRICLLVLSALIALGARGQSHSPADSVAESRKWPTVAQAAIGLGINAALTEGLKHTVHEMRPDRNGNNSFPSRHTSCAFAGATVFANATYRHSPAWPMVFHAAASGVAFQRVASRRHYASDVVAGAAIGIASAELGFALGRLISGSSPAPRGTAWDGFRPTLSVTSEALYTIAQPGDGKFCTGYSTALRARLPISGRHGIGLTLAGSTTPVKVGGAYAGPLNAIGASAGWAAQFALPHPALAIAAGAEAGAIRLLHTDNWEHKKWAATARADAALMWRLTKHFAASAGVSANISNIEGATGAIGLSIGSVAVF